MRFDKSPDVKGGGGEVLLKTSKTENTNSPKF